MRFRIWRIHQAEKNLPLPFFIAFALIAISICITIWVYGNHTSKTMYNEVSKVIEEQQELFDK